SGPGHPQPRGIGGVASDLRLTRPLARSVDISALYLVRDSVSSRTPTDSWSTYMRLIRIMALAFTFVAILAGAGRAQGITLSVAVSLKEAIESLGKDFAAGRAGTTLHYNFGASGDLQKRIEAGAPVDLFLSAAVRQMDELEKKNLIVSASRRAFAQNVLT